MREILTINGGPSNVGFATGSTDPFLRADSLQLERPQAKRIKRFDWLEEQVDFKSLGAVGHRAVHRLNYVEPLLLTPQVIAEHMPLFSHG